MNQFIGTFWRHNCADPALRTIFTSESAAWAWAKAMLARNGGVVSVEGISL